MHASDSQNRHESNHQTLRDIKHDAAARLGACERAGDLVCRDIADISSAFDAAGAAFDQLHFPEKVPTCPSP